MTSVVIKATAEAVVHSVSRSQTHDAVDMAWTAAIFLLALTAFSAGDQAETQVQQAKQAVAAANNAFSMDLYQLLRSKSGNMIVSPFSAMAAMTMVLQGAGGQTAQQLQSAMHLPADPATVRQGYKAFLGDLQKNEEIIVRIANKVFAQLGAHIKAPFHSTVVDVFRADAQELDFQRKTEESRVAINRWVEQITDNKIKELLTDLDPSTLMVLVNAIYFKGNWSEPFEEHDTRNGTFHTAPGSRVIVPMMHKTSRFGLMALPDLGARVLEMPYKGKSMKMLVILPDAVDGLQRVEQGLSSLNLTRIKQEMSYREVDVTLPKFKIESEFQLIQYLEKLGIRDLFFAGANLTGITDEQVLVSKVVQKAFVEVTETGTTAAAATAVVISPHLAIVSFSRPEVFKVDHPFLFLLMTSEGVVTFMGRVEHPML